MKFSRFRGQDLWKMALKLAVVAVIAVAVIGVGVYFGGKYAGPKVSAFLEERKEKKAQKEEEEKLAAMQEESSEMQEESRGAEDTGNREAGSEDLSEDGQEGVSDGAEGGDGEPAPEEDSSDPAEDSAIHRYEYIVEDCSWPEALKKCNEKGGYLAVINSQEEYNYMIQEIEANQLEKIMFFLGATRVDGEEYYWVGAGGELIEGALNSAEQWMQNEPSFRDGDTEENVMAMFRYEEESRWVWNDIPENILQDFSYYSGKIGYICEYNE